MAKALLLLAALTLCCCMASLHAFSRSTCQCLWTVRRQIPPRVIKSIEIIPISGGCRRTEAIITRRNGSKVCVDPAESWFLELVKKLQSQKVAAFSTTAPPTAAPPKA